MRLEYDLNVGALYIRLSGQPVAGTDEAGDNANVDIDDDDNVVGIEVISAGHRWPVQDILRNYKIDDSEADQIRSYFLRPLTGTASGPQRTQDRLPVVTAEPTAPSEALVAA
jgi:uncharacterized protein YuzE